MDTPQQLYEDLVKTRRFTERLLADFHKPSDWLLQVHPQANHALWVAGHIGQTDNFFLSMVGPELQASEPDYQEKFGTGSEPTSRTEDYPPVGDVLAWMHGRRAALLSILERLAPDNLARPMPAGSPAFLSDYASVFRTANWHECIHAGQITVVRRALGYPPLDRS